MNRHREAIAEHLRAIPYIEMNNTDANVFAYLIGRDEVEAKEIEYALEYGQPRVSRSLKKLEQQGFVEHKTQERTGRGSNPYLFKLQPSWLDLLFEMIKEQQDKTMENYQNIFEESIKICHHIQTSKPIYDVEQLRKIYDLSDEEDINRFEKE